MTPPWVLLASGLQLGLLVAVIPAAHGDRQWTLAKAARHALGGDVVILAEDDLDLLLAAKDAPFPGQPAGPAMPGGDDFVRLTLLALAVTSGQLVSELTGLVKEGSA